MITDRARKPKHNKSECPTLTGNPPLGYLNYFTCPECGMHLFSYYDGDISRPDYRFKISDNWNYCSQCGVHLNLREWQHQNDVNEDDLILED